jgi:putative ABC transport system permease protein
VRTGISLAGVMFTVILIFMQLGFLGAVEQTATLLFDHLDFDLLLVSSEYLDFRRSGDFPRARLAQARVTGMVQDVLPLTVGGGLWLDPRPRSDPRLEPRRWFIVILGVEPATLPSLFRRPAETVFPDADDLGRQRAALARIGTVSIDRSSRPEYGNPEDRQRGNSTELNGIRVELVGDFAIGTGFGYNGLLMASEETLARVTGMPRDRVSFGLIQLARDADVLTTREALQQALPHDVQVYTRDEINTKERDFWVKTTSVGRFFTMGVVVGLGVGIIFVYQMILGDIRSRLHEYATAKALGYTNTFLSRIVLSQALLLALVGYLLGWLSTLRLYALTRGVTRLPIAMTVDRVVLVFLFAVFMCLCSGLLAVRKAHTSDPADLF